MSMGFGSSPVLGPGSQQVFTLFHWLQLLTRLVAEELNTKPCLLKWWIPRPPECERLKKDSPRHRQKCWLKTWHLNYSEAAATIMLLPFNTVFRFCCHGLEEDQPEDAYQENKQISICGLWLWQEAAKQERGKGLQADIFSLFRFAPLFLPLFSWPLATSLHVPLVSQTMMILWVYLIASTCTRGFSCRK